MKNYEEITKNLLERRERFVAEKKKKRKKVVGIVVPVCCFTIISLLVVGMFKGGNPNGSLMIPSGDNNQEEISDNNDSNNIIDIFNKDNKETTKANKVNKVDKNNDNKNNKTTTEAIATDEYSEDANDYNSDSNGGRLPPNKDHNNNIDHNQDTTQGETINPDANKFIMKIEVTQMPVKTVYYVGDTFDFRGLEVTGYFSTGEVEDITPYVQIYNEKAYSASDKYGIYMEYTDNSDAINLAYTEFYVKVLEPDIDISQKNITLDVGENAKNTAITQAGGCTITWHSTDTSVVTVDSNGNITAVGSGSASVYAEISLYGTSSYTFQKQSPYCTVTVN